MIKIEGLFFHYPKQQELFSDLNLTLRDGAVHGLLGKNGAGKTTLLKIIAGLRKPMQGECRAYGYDTDRRLPDYLSQIYFVPEEFKLPAIKMKEYIDTYGPFYPDFNQDDLNDYLTKFELPKSGKLTDLSFGQKKKFLISFGLATNCRLLILDEPTNGLDIPSKSKFRQVLASSINSSRTFIVSTHQVRDIDQLIDPIVILDDGKIIFNQDLNSISNNLKIQVVDDLPDREILYSENTIGGYSIVEENQTGESSAIDVETVFNAVIKNKEKMKQLFSRSKDQD